MAAGAVFVRPPIVVSTDWSGGPLAALSAARRRAASAASLFELLPLILRCLMLRGEGIQQQPKVTQRLMHHPLRRCPLLASCSGGGHGWASTYGAIKTQAHIITG